MAYVCLALGEQAVLWTKVVASSCVTDTSNFR